MSLRTVTRCLFNIPLHVGMSTNDEVMLHDEEFTRSAEFDAAGYVEVFG